MTELRPRVNMHRALTLEFLVSANETPFTKYRIILLFNPRQTPLRDLCPASQILDRIYYMKPLR